LRCDLDPGLDPWIRHRFGIEYVGSDATAVGAAPARLQVFHPVRPLDRDRSSQMQRETRNSNSISNLNPHPNEDDPLDPFGVVSGILIRNPGSDLGVGLSDPRSTLFVRTRHTNTRHTSTRHTAIAARKNTPVHVYRRVPPRLRPPAAPSGCLTRCEPVTGTPWSTLVAPFSRV